MSASPGRSANVTGMRFALSLAFIAATALLHATGAKTNDALYVDLTGDFSRLVDETAGMPDGPRVAKFHERMAPLLPGFYEPRFGATAEKYDARIARALNAFSARRAQYEQVQREFP